MIDAKIAGQGSAVDVGGALPQILSGILSALENSKIKIELSEPPMDGETPQELADKGLTVDEVKAAFNGERTVVQIGRDSGPFFISLVEYSNDNSWHIAFETYDRLDDGSFGNLAAYVVSNNSGEINVLFYEQ